DPAGRGGRDRRRRDAVPLGDPRRDDGAWRPDLGGGDPAGDGGDVGRRGAAGRAVAGAGRIRHRCRGISGGGGGGDRGGGGAAAPRLRKPPRARGLRRAGGGCEAGVRAGAGAVVAPAVTPPRPLVSIASWAITNAMRELSPTTPRD